MTLESWSPFREIDTLRNEMDRLISERFARWSKTMRPGMPISLDMYEKNGSLIIETDLPGLKAEDIQINVSGNSLTIRGEFKSEDEDERGNVYYLERQVGKFQRTVTLPENIDTDRVEAFFDDGVLKLSLPKSGMTHPKKISVKSKP